MSDYSGDERAESQGVAPKGRGKLAVECVEWRALERNTLRGFATLRIPALRLTLRDCPVHRSGPERAWVALPARPVLGPDGAAETDATGRVRYAAVLEWDSREVGDAFSRAALTAVERFTGGPLP